MRLRTHCRIITVCSVMLACLGAPLHDAGAAGRRVALVIGNGAYQGNFPSLEHPGNDAVDMATRLKQLGFELIGGDAYTNLPKQQMNALIEKFANSVDRGDVALFYFAGHGMGTENTNWIFPTDVHIKYREDIAGVAVNVNSVMTPLTARHALVNLIIIDACRDFPLPSRDRGFAGGGLAGLPTDQPGTYIAFAAGVGERAEDGDAVDRNGVFTGAFLRALRNPNRSLDDMMYEVKTVVQRSTKSRQHPFVYSSLLSPFFFIGGAQSSTWQPAIPPAPQPPPTRVPQVEIVPMSFGTVRCRFFNGEISAFRSEENCLSIPGAVALP